MKLLGWDTSSKTGALVALEWDERARTSEWGATNLVAEWSLSVQAQHSERLLWAIHQVLESARWKLAEVDVFAAGVGPGSFTGLRIGMTTARILAHSLGKPLIGVSSLAALARPAALVLAESNPGAVLIACTDACKGELFALFGPARAVAGCVAFPGDEASGDFQGIWKKGAHEGVLPPEELMRKVKRSCGADGWLAIGEGRRRYPEAWKTLPRGKELADPLAFGDQVQGRYLGMLAWEAWQGGIARRALEVQPRYLRASDAELKLRAGLLRKAP